METEGVGSCPFGFRSTLETSLVEWKLDLCFSSHHAGGLLGNFLSGMETKRAAEKRQELPALETSLVEWKPDEQKVHLREQLALETSLVEWKPTSPPRSRPPPWPWKLP